MLAASKCQAVTTAGSSVWTEPAFHLTLLFSPAQPGQQHTHGPTAARHWIFQKTSELLHEPALLIKDELLLVGDILHWGNPQVHAYGLPCLPLLPKGLKSKSLSKRCKSDGQPCPCQSVPEEMLQLQGEVSAKVWSLQFYQQKGTLHCWKIPCFSPPHSDQLCTSFQSKFSSWKGWTQWS